MFRYYLELALRSLRRSPGLTALMVLAIGFGVAASMTAGRCSARCPAIRSRGNHRSCSCRRSTCGGRARRSATTDPTRAAGCARLQRCGGADARPPRDAAVGDVQVAPSVVPAAAGQASDQCRRACGVQRILPDARCAVPVRQRLERGRRRAARRRRGDQRQAQRKTVRRRQQRGQDAQHGRPRLSRGRRARATGIRSRRYLRRGQHRRLQHDPEDVFLPFRHAIAIGMPNDGNTNCNATPRNRVSWACSIPAASGSPTWCSSTTRRPAQSYQDLSGQAMRAPALPVAGRRTMRLRDLMAWLDHEQVVPPRYQGLAAGRARVAAGVSGQYGRACCWRNSCAAAARSACVARWVRRATRSTRSSSPRRG